MKKAWWKQSVVYQIYPRSFQDSNGDGIGDLPGITSRLPYLRDLGVDVLWLSPFYPSPGKDNGYDISDYRNIDPRFGTLADFDRMLAEIHRLGMKLVVDLVVNHTSDQHPWFLASRSSRDDPYRDYYIWRDGVNGGPPNNWGGCFSGSCWTFDEATQQYYLHTFGAFQPELNWENPQVRREVYDMMRWWCERGVDGFRMDVISFISKTPEMPDGAVGPGALYGDFAPYVINGPRVHEFLREMNREVLSRYDLLTVGECAGLTVEQACLYANEDGSELSMAFQFEQSDLDGGDGTKWSTRRMRLPELKAVLDRWQRGLEGRAWNSLYWSNHDQPRIVSRLGDDSTPALRERSAKALALCLHMMQGTPYIYQGEELAMTNGRFDSLADFQDIESLNAYRELTSSGQMDPERMMQCLRWKSRDNARTPMQWTAGPNAGFTTGTPWIAVNENCRQINAADQVARPDSVYHFYQALIRLRHQYELIVYGRFDLLLPEDEQIFAYTRTLGQQRLLAVCDLSDRPAPFTLPESFAGGQLLLSDMDTVLTRSMTLRPWEAFAVMAR